MEINYENIIAGPCSIESREQFLTTVDLLDGLGFHNVRGGVWKPRTKPGGFEGLGEKAFEFVEDMPMNMDFFCEVANREQLKIALDHGLKGIWIGARTTVDPFAVQEIADALREYNAADLIVMVKNPVCPDIDLWEGAITRLINAGIDGKNIIAIHRGFKTNEITKYRNKPIWKIPLELKRRLPWIKIYIDPSHIAGDSKYLEEILYMAFNVYDYDGAIIECHCNPESAWTDAKQQVTPLEMKEILDMILAKKKSKTFDEKKLENWRNLIDIIDESILNMLQDRLKISKYIGNYKKENNITVFQESRWNKILDRLVKLGKEKGLDKEYIENIWEIIHERSIEEQK